MYGSWQDYVWFLCQYGATIEADPPEILGHVDGLCFIDPAGEVEVLRSVDAVLNEQYQKISFVYPQSSTPPYALNGALLSVAKKLYEKWSVVGYVTVSFVSFWDAFDSIPRLWAQSISFGMNWAFGGIGTASIACKDRTLTASNPSSSPFLSANIPEGMTRRNSSAILLSDIVYILCSLQDASSCTFPLQCTCLYAPVEMTCFSSSAS